jgi:hypothetical protein
MPTICLLSSTTGRRRTLLDSMRCAAAFALVSVLQKNTPFVMMSFAVNAAMSFPFATALIAISRSVTMPMSRPFSATGIAPSSPLHFLGNSWKRCRRKDLCMIFFTFIGILSSNSLNGISLNVCRNRSVEVFRYGN